MPEMTTEDVRPIFSEERLEDLKRLNEKTAEIASAQLAEKYGEAFIIVAMGNRLNMKSTTIVAAPVSKPDLIFTVWMDTEGMIQDDYASARLLFQLERQIQEALAGEGLPSAVNCVFPKKVKDESDLSLNLAELIHRYEENRILCRIIMTEKTEKAVGVLKEISRNIPCGLMVHIYELAETAFDQCAKDFSVYPSVTDAMIRAYQPVCTLFTLVENGMSDVDSSAPLEGKEG